MRAHVVAGLAALEGAAPASFGAHLEGRGDGEERESEDDSEEGLHGDG